MTDPREPLRLIASAEADPQLRDALRAIREHAPSMGALTALADNTVRAVREAGAAPDAGTHAGGSTASAHATSLATKLVIAGAVAGALVYAGVQRARVERHPRPQEVVPTQAPAAVPARDARAGSSAALRAGGDAKVGVQGATDQPLDARGGNGAGAQHAVESGVRSPRAASSVPDAQRSDVVSAPEQARQARSPKRLASATTPRRTPSAQTQQDSQAEAAGTPRAESELELLEEAQHALQREPRHALELLERHRRAFPRGDFAQERDVLTLEAFQRLHDDDALREGARAFMQRYPRSPHRARVEQLVEDLR